MTESSKGREYPSAPVPGVGAVVIHNGQVLLVRRAREPLLGWWSIPGGAVELGESLEQAVTREVAEETGILVTPVAMVRTLDRIERDRDGRVQYHYVLVDFLCRVSGTQARKESNLSLAVPACSAATDVSDARWVPLEGLAASAQFSVPDWTMRVVEDALRMAQSVPDAS